MTILGENKAVIISDEIKISQFLTGKSTQTLTLYHYFLNEFEKIGDIILRQLKP